ncbi:glycosyltransferase family 9 protein [Vibrio ouci]|uniref:Glycosyltransferase family 9 protein n=1 Tax=Vibrio ouci TaxID=2499078 RepID=A0A4Y8WBK3_9VIBR|nr:hypothetical protein [Vibrio ouci]TFH90292.1 hypothetical protein ELS82_17800 [Vibrio ouci]
MSLLIRLPDSMGCTVASTAVLSSLLNEYGRIKVVTPFPFLLEGFQGVDIINAEEQECCFDVDLRTYTARRPHNNYPYRPSYVHMTEIAQEQLGIRLKTEKPFIPLSEQEDDFGRSEVACYSKPLIWIQSTSTSFNRLWRRQNWITLVEKLSDRYDFIDLSYAHYSPRQSLAIARHSLAGICLDSFMVHGSAAVGAVNVLVLLGSSRAECVTYPGQRVFYHLSQCPMQPCGMHGYYKGCQQDHEHLFGDSLCIQVEPVCMQTIPVQGIEKAIELIDCSPR